MSLVKCSALLLYASDPRFSSIPGSESVIGDKPVIGEKLVIGDKPVKEKRAYGVEEVWFDLALRRMTTTRPVRLLSRSHISKQQYNISRNLGIAATSGDWPPQAHAALQAWLLKKYVYKQKNTLSQLDVAPPQQIQLFSVQEMFDALNRYLRFGGATTREGHVGMSGRRDLLVKKLPTTATVLGQTGFNAGHSAVLMLQSCACAKVVSFELDSAAGTGKRATIDAGLRFIELAYPGRHQCLFGRSQETLRDYDGHLFDAFLVDGGHSFSCAYDDLTNARRKTEFDGVVICDDVRLPSAKYEWEKGPTRAWLKAARYGVVKARSADKGLAWGKFLPELKVKQELGINVEEDFNTSMEAELDSALAEKASLLAVGVLDGGAHAVQVAEVATPALVALQSDGYEVTDTGKEALHYSI
jgi:hypothetical protein